LRPSKSQEAFSNRELRRRVKGALKARLAVLFPGPVSLPTTPLDRSRAYLRASAGERDPWELSADPNLTLR
jgi:hypothetical protein